MPAPQYSTQFGTALLQALHLPVTAANLAYLAMWANREGTAASFNPLATTEPAPGATGLAGNAPGVKNYTSFAEGVQATAQTLENGHYGDILAELKTGNANPSVQLAGLRTWSGGGYNNLAGVSSSANAAQGAGGSSSAAGAVSVGSGTANGTWTPADYANEIGWSLAVINSSPDLQKIFQAVEAAGPDGWSAARIQGAVQSTNWYRSMSDAQRQWQQLTLTDPATAHARSIERTQLISQTAASLGVQLSPAMLGKIVNDSLSLGLNTAQIQQEIAQNWKYTPNVTETGTAGTTIQDMQATSAAYAVPLSEQTLQSWTEKVLAGNATAQDFTDYARQQAMSLFPTLAPALQSGMTVAQYADPYKQMAQQITGANPGDINFLDPKWQKALDNIDPKTGQRAPMTLSDWSNLLRTDPTYGYDTSAQGRSQAATFATQLGQKFGALA